MFVTETNQRTLYEKVRKEMYAELVKNGVVVEDNQRGNFKEYFDLYKFHLTHPPLMIATNRYLGRLILSKN